MTILREQAVFGLSQWPRLFLFQLLNHHKNVPECHRGTLVIKAVSVHYLLLWSSRLICFTCLVSCQCPRGTLLTTLVFNSSTLPVLPVVNVPRETPEGIL